MRPFTIFFSLLMACVALSAWPWLQTARCEESGAPAPVQLTLTPVQAPARIISQDDAADPGARLFDGQIMRQVPPLQFSDGEREQRLNILGSDVCIQLQDGAFKLIVDDQPPRTLERDDRMIACRPVQLQLNGREYVLAFPFAFSHESQGALWYRSGAIQLGQFGQQSIGVYDQNTDGKYVIGEDALCIAQEIAGGAILLAPRAATILGTTDGIVKIDALSEDGSALNASAYSGPTGRLAVANAFEDLDVYLAFSDQTGGVAIVTRAGAKETKSVAIVPGAYQLLYGAVYSKQLNRVIALIAPGATSAINVTADATQEFSVGGPLTLQFAVGKPRKGSGIAIDSSTFKITGAAGEEYKAFAWNPATPPEVSASRGDTVKKIGKMEFG